MTEAIASPDWSALKPRQRVPIWQALALSLDVAPATLGVDHFYVLSSVEGGGGLLKADDPEWLTEMARRWQQLHKSLQGDDAGGLLLKKDKPELGAGVRLDEFAAWCKRKRWKTPKPFKQFIAQ